MSAAVPGRARKCCCNDGKEKSLNNDAIGDDGKDEGRD